MKLKIGMLGLLLTSQLSWAAPQELEFVTTLSSPIASFKKIETRSSQPVSFTGEDMVVNLGSKNATGSGNIVRIQGGTPFTINTLTMEDNSRFIVSNGKKWIVQNMYLGQNATVSPQALHVQTLQAGDTTGSARQVTINQQNLYMPGPVDVAEGSVLKEIHATNGGNSFNLSYSSEAAQEGTGGAQAASFQNLACSSQSQSAGTCSANETIKVLVAEKRS